MRYWFPSLYHLSNRIKIFRKTDSSLSIFFWIYWIISGNHITKQGFQLSNYGVWLAERQGDKTYNFGMDAVYVNTLERQLLAISDETVFIDIGANIGVFSLIAAQNPRILSIHSFEPDASSFEFLVVNIERNRAEKIHSHNYAIGVDSGEALLTRNEFHSGLAKIVTDTRSNDNVNTVKMVNHKYLDENIVLEDGSFFVKIDVEGYELEVLNTLRNTEFFTRISKFFIEFDLDFGKVQEVENFLKLNGFVERGRWGSNTHWDALWLKSHNKI